MFLGLFVAGIGNSFVFAILPPVGREMGLSDIQIGSIVTASAMVFMLMAPIWGMQAEKWGRRRVLMTAMSVYTVTTVLFALTIQFRLQGALPLLVAYGLLIVFRMGLTAGISGVFPASQAYMADVTPLHERTRAMAFIGIAVGSGMIVGPAVAATFAKISLVLPFYVVAALSVVAGISIWAFIVDPPRAPRDEETQHDGVFNRKTIPLFFMSGCMLTVLSGMQQATGFYFQDKFQLDADDTAFYVGVALMASAMASVSCQIFLVRRFGWPPRRLVVTGVPLVIIALTLLLTADIYPILVTSMAIFGLGFGMIMPGIVASLSMHAGVHNQGRVAGFNASAQGLGFMLGPMMGSSFYQIHPLLPYGVCLILMGIAVLNLVLFVRFPKGQE